MGEGGGVKSPKPLLNPELILMKFSASLSVLFGFASQGRTIYCIGIGLVRQLSLNDVPVYPKHSCWRILALKLIVSSVVDLPKILIINYYQLMYLYPYTLI